jgi:hypothetical protein
MTLENEIPVGGVGIVDLVSEFDLDLINQKISHLVKFVESAVFCDDGFGAAIVISKGKVHGVLFYTFSGFEFLRLWYFITA